MSPSGYRVSPQKVSLKTSRLDKNPEKLFGKWDTDHMVSQVSVVALVETLCVYQKAGGRGTRFSPVLTFATALTQTKFVFVSAVSSHKIQITQTSPLSARRGSLLQSEVWSRQSFLLYFWERTEGRWVCSARNLRLGGKLSSPSEETRSHRDETRNPLPLTGCSGTWV